MEDDLEYLRQNAFEFTLTINPGAGSFTTPQETTTYHGDRTENEAAEDWISSEQRDEAYRTGRYVEGRVYPCGSVSSFSFYGTSISDVVAACARECRDEQSRWMSNGMTPHSPIIR
jgi:hypothetical protein